MDIGAQRASWTTKYRKEDGWKAFDDSFDAIIKSLGLESLLDIVKGGES